jgi:hypothetical protein
MSWATTPWGLICAEIAAFVTDAAEGYPEFTIGIGPDEETLHDGGYRITFLAGRAALEEPRYGGGLEDHGTFDELIPTTVIIAAPTTLNTTTNLDDSPDLVDAVWERFLEGCDAVRHIPYLVPGTVTRSGGRLAENGSKYAAQIMIRIERGRTPATMGTATAVTMSLGVSGPDGDGGTVVDEFEVIGDATP